MCKLASKVLADEKKKLKFWNVAFLIVFLMLIVSNGLWMLQFLG